jgi:hypothetical protein
MNEPYYTIRTCKAQVNSHQKMNYWPCKMFWKGLKSLAPITRQLIKLNNYRKM